MSHGFRSTARNLLNESGKWSVDAIERDVPYYNIPTRKYVVTLVKWSCRVGRYRR
jgi:hypothetical protein